ncbi:hypothetical protein M2408_000761 [Sphingobacterium sp. BIGb0165]|nr:hypothetical protein [Sphingobacterium sp. BIGb0165]
MEILITITLSIICSLLYDVFRMLFFQIEKSILKKYRVSYLYRFNVTTSLPVF